MLNPLSLPKRQALAETKAMFACMRDKISAAVEKLEAELAAAGESEEAGPAKEALEKGRVALKDATTAEA